MHMRMRLHAGLAALATGLMIGNAAFAASASTVAALRSARPDDAARSSSTTAKPAAMRCEIDRRVRTERPVMAKGPMLT